MVQDDEAIVSLEAWRLAKRPGPTCAHPRTIVDQQNGTVECKECGASLSAFHVLVQIAKEENRLWERVRALRAEAKELKAWVPILKAVRELDRMWRGKRMLPCCPQCSRGLWPEEMTAAVGVQIEVARRKKAKIAIPAGRADDGCEIVGGGRDATA
jgi:hypothetical protein